MSLDSSRTEMQETYYWQPGDWIPRRRIQEVNVHEPQPERSDDLEHLQSWARRLNFAAAELQEGDVVRAGKTLQSLSEEIENYAIEQEVAE